MGISAFSATMSTVMPTARGLLAMATYRAVPGRFHRTAFSSPRTALAQVILPAIAAVVLSVLLVEARHMMDPDYGSGNSIAGIGTVFIVGVLGMALAVPLMLACKSRYPAFFRGETLRRQHAHWVQDDLPSAGPGT